MPTAADRSRGPKRLARRFDGERFGRLVVLRYAGQHKTTGRQWKNLWLCQCDCGSEPVTLLEHLLKEGRVRSCGCLTRERNRSVRLGALRKRYWEEWRAARRGEARVLWEPYWVLFQEIMVVKGATRKLIAMRWTGNPGKLGELMDSERARVPTAAEAEELALILNLRGMEKGGYLKAAAVAREAMAAFEARRPWAVEKVEAAR